MNHNEDYHKNYYTENKERYKEQKKKWLEENKDYWNAYQKEKAKMRYWKNKLVAEPENQKIKDKIENLLNEVKNKTAN